MFNVRSAIHSMTYVNVLHHLDKALNCVCVKYSQLWQNISISFVYITLVLIQLKTAYTIPPFIFLYFHSSTVAVCLAGPAFQHIQVKYVVHIVYINNSQRHLSTVNLYPMDTTFYVRNNPFLWDKTFKISPPLGRLPNSFMKPFYIICRMFCYHLPWHIVSKHLTYTVCCVRMHHHNPWFGSLLLHILFHRYVLVFTNVVKLTANSSS